jgi:chaperonin cofactor prefoldin
MNVLFRSRCEAMVRECVNVSLELERREADRVELLRAGRLERRARRRVLRRRVESLEREVEALRSEQAWVRQRLSADDALLAELGDDLRRRLDEDIEERRAEERMGDFEWTSL